MRATTGTLKRNADPHQNFSSRAPETIGPSAPPAPAKATHVAIAFGRSAGGNTAVSSESVAGITNAAPAPWIARPTITIAAEPANPLTTAPTPNRTRPNSNVSLRPKRSPSAPATSRRPANTSA